jgi:2-amino-4-hydroxy-6-hydroxymethyldihydropteridine diphosphokinase
MACVYISLGSNIGDRMTTLSSAMSAISSTIGTIIQYSGIYETQSWGYKSNSFLNIVIEIETMLTPEALLNALHKIETEMGRIKRSSAYADRTIDLDILFYENQIISLPHLIIPHPHIQKRLFVLIPLNEIAPELNHPLLHSSIKKLKDVCTDKSWVNFFGKFNSGEV